MKCMNHLCHFDLPLFLKDAETPLPSVYNIAEVRKTNIRCNVLLNEHNLLTETLHNAFITLWKPNALRNNINDLIIHISDGNCLGLLYVFIY